MDDLIAHRSTFHLFQKITRVLSPTPTLDIESGAKFEFNEINHRKFFVQSADKFIPIYTLKEETSNIGVLILLLFLNCHSSKQRVEEQVECSEQKNVAQIPVHQTSSPKIPYIKLKLQRRCKWFGLPPDL